MVEYVVPNALTPEQVRTTTQQDVLLQELIRTIQSTNWQDSDLSSFFHFGDEQSVSDGIILHDHHLLAPSSLHTHTGLSRWNSQSKRRYGSRHWQNGRRNCSCLHFMSSINPYANMICTSLSDIINPFPMDSNCYVFLGAFQFGWIYIGSNWHI